MRRIELRDETDRRRYRCPRNHTTWEPTNHHFWCHSCSRTEGVDASFDHLRDAESGNLLARDDVQLLTEAGLYEEGSVEG